MACAARDTRAATAATAGARLVLLPDCERQWRLWRGVRLDWGHGRRRGLKRGLRRGLRSRLRHRLMHRLTFKLLRRRRGGCLIWGGVGHSKAGAATGRHAGLGSAGLGVTGGRQQTGAGTAMLRRRGLCVRACRDAKAPTAPRRRPAASLELAAQTDAGAWAAASRPVSANGLAGQAPAAPPCCAIFRQLVPPPADGWLKARTIPPAPAASACSLNVSRRPAARLALRPRKPAVGLMRQDAPPRAPAAAHTNNTAHHLLLRAEPMAAPSGRRRVRARARVSTAAVFAVIVVLLAALAAASAGDVSPEFKQCVASRYADVCGPDGVDDGVTGRPSKNPRRLPLTLRLTGWTCYQDCEYHCMHQLTNRAAANVHDVRKEVRHRLLAAAGARDAWDRSYENSLVRGALQPKPQVQWRMVQYHGKWVFLRVLGAQEPVSVLASLATSHVHLYAFYIMARSLPFVFPLRSAYLLYPVVSLLASLASALDHTHTKPWTDAAAQVTASAAVTYILFLTIARLWRWAPRPALSVEHSPSLVQDVHSQHCFWRLAMVCGAGWMLYMLYRIMPWHESEREQNRYPAVPLLVSLVQLGLLGCYAVRPTLLPGGRVAHHAVLLPSNSPPPAPGIGPGLCLNDQVDHYELRAAPQPALEQAPVIGALIETPLSGAHRRQPSFPLDIENRACKSLISFSPDGASTSASGAAFTLLAPIPLAQRRRMLLALVPGTLLCLVLHTWNFPPLGRVLDGEALAQLLKIPLAMGLYQFLLADAHALTYTHAQTHAQMHASSTRAATRASISSTATGLDAGVHSSTGSEAPWIATDRHVALVMGATHRTQPGMSLSAGLARTRTSLLAPLARVSIPADMAALRCRGLRPLLGAIDSVADTLESGLGRVFGKHCM